MKFLGIGLAVLLVAALMAGCGGDDGTVDGYNTKTVNNITLMWKTNDAEDSLLVKVSATTVGWVAVGFDPTVGMQDANIIIGYVLNDTAYVRDDVGTGLHSHAPDTSLGGTNDVADIDGTETEGITEISFTIPLDSGDLRDRVLVVGESYLVILAWGTDDDFDALHTVRVSTEIEI